MPSKIRLAICVGGRVMHGARAYGRIRDHAQAALGNTSWESLYGAGDKMRVPIWQRALAQRRYAERAGEPVLIVRERRGLHREESRFLRLLPKKPAKKPRIDDFLVKPRAANPLAANLRVANPQPGRAAQKVGYKIRLQKVAPQKPVRFWKAAPAKVKPPQGARGEILPGELLAVDGNVAQEPGPLRIGIFR